MEPSGKATDDAPVDDGAPNDQHTPLPSVFRQLCWRHQRITCGTMFGHDQKKALAPTKKHQQATEAGRMQLLAYKNTMSSA